jgi:hypothetical protein
MSRHCNMHLGPDLLSSFVFSETRTLMALQIPRLPRLPLPPLLPRSRLHPCSLPPPLPRSEL